MNKLNTEMIPMFEHLSTTYLKLYLNYIGHGFTYKYNKQTIGKYLREYIEHLPFFYDCLISRRFCDDRMKMLCKINVHKQELKKQLSCVC